jgi:hypothetical protein
MRISQQLRIQRDSDSSVLRRPAGEDRASLPAQKAICAKIAQQYSLIIVRTVELVDVSGAAVLKTPEMQELLATLERGEIHGVVAREFSRLERMDKAQRVRAGLTTKTGAAGGYVVQSGLPFWFHQLCSPLALGLACRPSGPV